MSETADATSLDTVGVALRVAAAVEKVGGAYFVGGSLASSFQGEPRATNDVDIVLQLPVEEILRFIDALGSDFEVDPDMLRAALSNASACNLFFLPSLTRVALSGVGSTPYDELEFSRRSPVVVREPDVTLVVKSAEDTVLGDLRSFLKGGEVSERQWRDVLQVLKLRGEGMDTTYLARWAIKLDVDDLLRRAVDEVAT